MSAQNGNRDGDGGHDVGGPGFQPGARSHRAVADREPPAQRPQLHESGGAAARRHGGLGNPAQFNAQFNVSVLGGPASRTAITVDGGNVRNPIEGGPGQNFSQEVVQEFQISTANFDLSTGIAAFGAINIVTRSGSNDLRGAGLFLLSRSTTWRPIRAWRATASPTIRSSHANRAGSSSAARSRRTRCTSSPATRRTDQHGVYVVQPDLPSVAAFGTLAPAPYVGNQISGRVDYRLSNKHTLFVPLFARRNTNSGPFGIPVPPSNFVSNNNYVDQQLVGVTSVLGPTLVNDFRFSHMYWRNRNAPAACEGDISGNCIGSGGPEIFYLNSVNFALGNNFNSPQGRDLHRFPISNNTTWQKGTPPGEVRRHLGARRFDVGYWGFFDPARAYLLSPEFLAESVNPACPRRSGCPTASIHTQADLMRLPVVDVHSRHRRSRAAVVQPRRRPRQRSIPSVRPGQLAGDAGSHAELRSRVAARNQRAELRSREAGVPRADLRQRSEPDRRRSTRTSRPRRGSRGRFGKERPTRHSRRRGDLLRHAAGLVAARRAGGDRRLRPAVHRQRGRDQPGSPGSRSAPRSSTRWRYNYGTFLHAIADAARAAGGQVPGDRNHRRRFCCRSRPPRSARCIRASSRPRAPTTSTSASSATLNGEARCSGRLRLPQDAARHARRFLRRQRGLQPFNAIEGPVIPRCTRGAGQRSGRAVLRRVRSTSGGRAPRREYKGLLLKADKRFSNRYQSRCPMRCRAARASWTSRRT